MKHVLKCINFAMKRRWWIKSCIYTTSSINENLTKLIKMEWVKTSVICACGGIRWNDWCSNSFVTLAVNHLLSSQFPNGDRFQETPRLFHHLVMNENKLWYVKKRLSLGNRKNGSGKRKWNVAMTSCKVISVVSRHSLGYKPKNRKYLGVRGG